MYWTAKSAVPPSHAGARRRQSRPAAAAQHSVRLSNAIRWARSVSKLSASISSLTWRVSPAAETSGAASATTASAATQSASANRWRASQPASQRARRARGGTVATASGGVAGTASPASAARVGASGAVGVCGESGESSIRVWRILPISRREWRHHTIPHVYCNWPKLIGR
jgi:hypothetical protein